MHPEASNDDRRADPMRLLVFGCGYSAGHFVAGLDRDRIEGVTVRTGEKASDLAAKGLTPFVFGGERPGEGLDAALHRTTHLLLSIPPGHAAPAGASAGGANATPGDPVLRWYRDTIVHAAPELQWIGYLSTVGVYGDRDGGWVDETATPQPASARSRERVAAEEAWRAVAVERGVPLAILRLSGIYGPARNVFRNLANGTARRLVKPGQVFNRIHVSDIAGVLELLATRRVGGVFNVTDDEPAPPQDVVATAAAMVDAPLPPETAFADADLSPMARSFYGENKRVSNAAIKRLGYRFQYPTYREGLAALRDDYGGEQENGSR